MIEKIKHSTYNYSTYPHHEIKITQTIRNPLPPNSIPHPTKQPSSHRWDDNRSPPIPNLTGKYTIGQ